MTQTLKTVTLTEAQRETLMREIDKVRDEQGLFELSVELDDRIEVNLSGWVEYVRKTWHDPSGICPDETEQTGRRTQLWVFAGEYDEEEDGFMAVRIDAESERELARRLQDGAC